MLDALRDKMMAPDVMAAFIVAYNDEGRGDAGGPRPGSGWRGRRNCSRSTARLAASSTRLNAGAWSPAVQERLTALEGHKRTIIEMRSQRAGADKRYRDPARRRSRRIGAWWPTWLQRSQMRTGQAAASEALRSLIDKIVMVPDAAAPDRHQIKLYGDLAVALKLGRGAHQQAPVDDDGRCPWESSIGGCGDRI